MKLELDLNTMTSQQLGWAVQTIDAYRAIRDGFTVAPAQPEVAQNTGSSEPAPPFTGDPAGESAAAEAAPTANEAAAPAVTEQKRGRGRPRKEQLAGTASEGAGDAALPEGASAKPSEEQAPAEPATESARPITIDQLRAALQTFTAKNGIEAGMPLLAKYNARRISEMVEQSEADKNAFIEECYS